LQEERHRPPPPLLLVLVVVVAAMPMVVWPRYQPKSRPETPMAEASPEVPVAVLVAVDVAVAATVQVEQQTRRCLLSLQQTLAVGDTAAATACSRTVWHLDQHDSQ